MTIILNHSYLQALRQMIQAKGAEPLPTELGDVVVPVLDISTLMAPKEATTPSPAMRFIAMGSGDFAVAIGTKAAPTTSVRNAFASYVPPNPILIHQVVLEVTVQDGTGHAYVSLGAEATNAVAVADEGETIALWLFMAHTTAGNNERARNIIFPRPILWPANKTLYANGAVDNTGAATNWGLAAHFFYSPA